MRRSVALLLACLVVTACGGSQQPARESSLDELRALPYVGETPVRTEDRGKLGVQTHDPEAYSGVNVYCSEAQDGARLLDMKGQVIHEFRALPCKLIEPYDRETFLMLVYPSGLMRLDWDSNVLWHNDAFLHHDFAVTSVGDVWVITSAWERVRYRGLDLDFRGDELALLGPDGRRKDGFSLFGALQSIYPKPPLDRLWEAVRSGDAKGGPEDLAPDDLLHANTVELLERDGPLGPAGALLVCIRHANLVVVIDPGTKEVLWSWGADELDMPHQPTVISNGNLLIFDNGGERGWSRLIELDPATKKIVWEYRSDTPLFYSRSRGSVQQLPNGNVLVAESDRGRVFEVTRDGRVVWEYWASESQDADGSFLRRTIYRASRWTPEMVDNPRFRSLWETIPDGRGGHTR